MLRAGAQVLLRVDRISPKRGCGMPSPARVVRKPRAKATPVEEACEKAVDHDDWQSAEEDGDGSRGTTISAIKLVPDDCDLDQFSLSEFLYRVRVDAIDAVDHAAARTLPAFG